MMDTRRHTKHFKLQPWYDENYTYVEMSQNKQTHPEAVTEMANPFVITTKHPNTYSEPTTQWITVKDKSCSN